MSKGLGWVIKLVAWFTIYFSVSLAFNGDMPFWAYFLVVFLCVVVQRVVEGFVNSESKEDLETNTEENKGPIIPDEVESNLQKDGQCLEDSVRTSDVKVLSLDVDSPIINEPEDKNKDKEPSIELTSEESPKTGTPSQLKGGKPKFSLSNWLKSLSKTKRIGLAFVLCILLALLVTVLIVAIKPYPDYIRSFSDKWRYAFDMPNNDLANTLYEEAITKRNKKSFFFVNGENCFWQDNEEYYNNVQDYINKYKDATVYTQQIEIKSLSAIGSSGVYAVRMPNSSTWERVSGRDCYNQYLEWKEKDSTVRVISLRKYDMEASYEKEHQLIENASTLPITDPEIAKKIAGYYEDEHNYNKAADIYMLSLKHKKTNPPIWGSLALAQYYNSEPDDARASAEKALSLDSKECLSLQVLSQIEADDFNWGEAKKWSKKAIDYGCENAEPYYVYAQALFKQDEKEAARDYYNKAYNIDEYSPLAEKYEECGGCPFDLISMEFAFSNYNGDFITNFGDKLYSSKSQYIKPRLNLDIKRDVECKIQCKLYSRGTLSTGEGSKGGYSYEQDMYLFKTGKMGYPLKGWGSTTPGHWPAGNYRFEVWYKGEMVGEESFRLY